MFKRVICLMLLLFLCAGAQAEVYLQKPPAEWADKILLEWTCFDVNEGDAHLLQCAGESMLLDGGPNPSREDLRIALEERGLKESMKYIMNSHYHDDHINGIYHLFQNGFTPSEFLHPYNDWAIRNDKLGSRTVKQAKKIGVPVRRVQPGDELMLGEAVIELFQCDAYGGTNQRSMVAKVTFGNASILLAADISGTVQHWFMENLPKGTFDVDLLKLPHHAITPVVPAFLDMVSPVGMIATNRSSDVDVKSQNQLKERALPVFFSGDGTVYAVTDGTDWYIWQTPGEF